ncbi:MAG: hypothetical protein QOG35_2202 [Solirubrobacteraceae bacterium]|nr:hypothetical protein [Solirubrobacteraceae bacterium]
MRERFDATTGLVVVGSILLLVSLFIDWYRPGGNAWTVFEFDDVALAGAAVCGLLAAAPRFDGLARALPVIALATLALVAVQVIDLPPAARGADREAGVWLALAASALMAVGALLAAASISVIVDVRGRERRRRTAAIDARDAAAAVEAAAEEDDAVPPPGRRSSRRGRSLFDSEAPPAPPPPAAPPHPADDPQRTQALDPVDPPKEP